MIRAFESLRSCRRTANSASPYIIALLLFLCAPVSRTWQVSAEQALIHRIQAGDVDAIAEAGNSRNTLFAPYIRHQLTSHPEQPTLTGPATIALAKIGESDALQQVWCISITDDPRHGLSPHTEDLESVGGWYAIQGLEKLLTPDGLVHWHKLSNKEKANDALEEPLVSRASKALHKLIPAAPEDSQKQWNWHEWIAAHQRELSRLQPRGDGVDFSPNACKNDKPRNKHNN